MTDKQTELLPPAFRSAFHGEGAAHYASDEARRQYAKALLRFSGRLFFVPFGALVSFSVIAPGPAFGVLCGVALAAFAGATYSRHYALLILDTLPPRKRGRAGKAQAAQPSPAAPQESASCA